MIRNRRGLFSEFRASARFEARGLGGFSSVDFEHFVVFYHLFVSVIVCFVVFAISKKKQITDRTVQPNTDHSEKQQSEGEDRDLAGRRHTQPEFPSKQTQYGRFSFVPVPKNNSKMQNLESL